MNSSIKCKKCFGKMFVDRVFLSQNHLELYCITCGKREMYSSEEQFGEREKWIMKLEKVRAKKSGHPL
jgi:hypothetical protein